MAAGLCPALVAVAQPANDDCATVQAAAANIPAAGGVIAGTTVGANSDGTCTCDDGGPGNLDVFYKFIPNVSGTWQFSLCTGSTLDSVMSLHSGCPADPTNQIVCNDDGCGGIGVPSVFTASLTAGTMYMVRVGMWDSFDNFGDTFTLTVASQASAGACCNTTSGACTVSPTGATGCASGTTFQGTGTACTPNPCPQPPPPANNDCATVLASGPTIAATGGTVSGSTQFATNDGDCSCDSGSTTPGKDVYWRFTPATSGAWSFSLCGVTPVLDTVVSIHTSCPADATSQIACDDDACGTIGGWSSAAATLNAGTTYLVRVGMWSGTAVGGAFTLVVAPTTLGACCNTTSGACTSSTTGGAGCAAGTVYQGDNSTCSPSPCPREACCNAVTGVCTVAAVGVCASGTTGQGVGSVCTPNPCPQPPPPANDECTAAVAVTLGTVATGSNVNATTSATLTTTNTGSCAQVSFNTGIHKDVWYRFVAPATTNYVIDTCGSTMPDTVISIHSGCPADQSNILDCNDDAATVCTNSGLNSRIVSVALTGGSTYYIGVAGYNGASGAFNLLVNYVDASLVGSCCVSTTCTLSDAANCAGTFTAGGTCTPSPCGGPTGVCCRGATCTTTITSAAACTASLIGGQTAGASFPSGAACNAAVISNAPCCYADYNKVGGITVTDIFNFLTDWFAGSPYARVGSNGGPGPLAVQNIFDFLTNWFAGGC